MSEIESDLSRLNLNEAVDDEVTPVAKEPIYVQVSFNETEGPDQVLIANAIVTSRADGCVKLIHEPYEALSIPGLLSQMARKYPYHPALVSRPNQYGVRKVYNYEDYETEVRSVAKAFIHLGLQRHHSVAILGFNSPEWFICALAAIHAGGIATGIYTTNSVEACQYCAENSNADIIVVDDDTQLQKILKIRANLPNLKAIIQYEGTPDKEGVLSWAELLEIGRSKIDQKLNNVLKTIGVNECCSIVFTSGTVGNPKAVMISHDNFISTARISKETHQFKEGHEVLVSYLPLSHVAAQMADLIMGLVVAATVHFADKNALKGSLIDTLVFAKPTTFLGVPRVWEKFHENFVALSEKKNIFKAQMLQWAKMRGLNYSINKMNGVDSKPWGYSIAKYLLFDKIKEQLGLDKCKLFLTGAAPLRDEIKKYFMSIDIVIIDLYGMSECSGAHVFSTNQQFKMGSIGKVPKEFEMKLDSPDSTGEGEIFIRGPHVFMGYLNDPEKTREAIDDERWLHTGDLGKIDEDGFVYITGRIKELIITSGGENIPRLKIEQQLLQELPPISHVMLIGDDKKFLTLFLTFKTESNHLGVPIDDLTYSTILWAKSIGSQAKSVSEIITSKDPAVYAQIEAAIERVNNCATSKAQKIQKFKVLPFDFSIATKELGPTLKLKRRIVLDKYKYLVDEMYRAADEDV